MISPQTLRGNWKEIQGKLKSTWGSLTDDDVKEFDGNVEQLMGRLQKKTGAAREKIDQFFDQFTSNAATAVSRADEAVRGYAQQASEAVQEGSKQAGALVREGYADVEDMVRHRPATSMGVCFGTGVITGVLISLLFLRR